MTRNRKDFNLKRFRDKVSGIDWNIMYCMDDLNLVNDYFETQLQNILQSEAPLKVTQVRAKHKSWISLETRQVMQQRDTARVKAQTSKSREDWAAFRTLRNHCNSLCKSDKTKHFKRLYDNHEGNKDNWAGRLRDPPVPYRLKVKW